MPASGRRVLRDLILSEAVPYRQNLFSLFFSRGCETIKLGCCGHFFAKKLWLQNYYTISGNFGDPGPIFCRSSVPNRQFIFIEPYELKPAPLSRSCERPSGRILVLGRVTDEDVPDGRFPVPDLRSRTTTSSDHPPVCDFLGPVGKTSVYGIALYSTS